MGQISVLNLTGESLTITSLEVSNTDLVTSTETQTVANGTEFSKGYTYNGSFTGMTLDYTQNSTDYAINLDNSNWFGANSAYHYPGENSDIRMIIVGFVNGSAKATIILQFRESGKTFWDFSSDASKALDASSAS